MKYRTEFDSLGKVRVPGDKYWGASTERSNKLFDIGDFWYWDIACDFGICLSEEGEEMAKKGEEICGNMIFRGVEA